MIGAMRPLPLADRRNGATDYFVLVFKKHFGQDKNFSMLPATTSWRIRTMSNRRFEMYDYRQIIHRIRMGQTDRKIARTKIIGRTKCGQIRAIAPRIRTGLQKKALFRMTPPCRRSLQRRPLLIPRINQSATAMRNRLKPGLATASA